MDTDAEGKANIARQRIRFSLDIDCRFIPPPPSSSSAAVHHGSLPCHHCKTPSTLTNLLHRQKLAFPHLAIESNMHRLLVPMSCLRQHVHMRSTSPRPSIQRVHPPRSVDIEAMPDLGADPMAASRWFSHILVLERVLRLYLGLGAEVSPVMALEGAAGDSAALFGGVCPPTRLLWVR